MTTFGLVSHYRRWVLAIISACVLAQTTQAAQPLVTQSITDMSALSRLGAVANNALNTFANIHYYTAEEISLPVPGTDQKVTFRWGFGGSGDPFSGFPKIKISVEQATPADKTTATNFSFIELSKLLIQEKLLNQDNNNVALLSWLSNRTVSGHKLFFIKLFLLVKDFHTSEQLPQFKTELFRLLTKLCLTENNGLIDTTTPLSNHLPTSIKDTIKALCPDVLGTVDAVWSTIVNNNAATVSIETNGTAARTVYAFAFKDDNQAQSFYNQFNNYQKDSEAFNKEAAEWIAEHKLTDTAWDDFVRFTNAATSQSGLQQTLEPLISRLNPIKAMISCHQFSLTTPPSYIPAEVTTALNAVTVVPAIVRVTTNGNTWVAHVTNQISSTQSVTMATQALIHALKGYIAARNELFTQHPEQAKAYQEAWEKREKANRRVQAFLATDDGIAATQQLNTSLAALEQSATVTAPAANTIEAQLAQASADLVTKRAALAKLQTSLTAWKQLSASAAVNDVTEMAKREQAVFNMQKTVQILEQTIATYNAQRLSNENKEEAIKTQIKPLQEAADYLKKNGEPVPAELTEQINELSKKLKKPAQPVALPAANQPLSIKQLLAQREQMACIYQGKATEVTALLAQRQAAVNGKGNKTECILFTAKQKPGYEAYAKHLTTQAQELRNENNKVRELLELRETVKKLGADDEVDEATATRMATLEAEVGHLTTPQNPVTCLLKSFIANPELKELVTDLSSNPAYATIREKLIRDLSQITQKSPYVEKNATVIRYLLQTQAPELLPLFDQLVKGPKSSAWFGA